MDWLLRRVRFLHLFHKPFFFWLHDEYFNLPCSNITYTGITTSTVDMREDAGGRPFQKAKVYCENNICQKTWKYAVRYTGNIAWLNGTMQFEVIHPFIDSLYLWDWQDLWLILLLNRVSFMWRIFFLFSCWGRMWHSNSNIRWFYLMLDSQSSNDPLVDMEAIWFYRSWCAPNLPFRRAFIPCITCYFFFFFFDKWGFCPNGREGVEIRTGDLRASWDIVPCLCYLLGWV